MKGVLSMMQKVREYDHSECDGFIRATMIPDIPRCFARY